MPKITPDISLIVTTYNWESALELLLCSIKKQQVMPLEVVIGDDGSKQPTTDLIKRFQRDFPVPLKHIWQEDTGFRAGAIRNKAIAACSGEYIVMIDGDMVLSPHFIADHKAYVENGSFLQGSRVILGPDYSQAMLANSTIFESEKLSYPHVLTSDIGNRKNTLRCSLLTKRLLNAKQNDKGIRTCNFSAWKQDLITVNGFNESIEGWGREDAELAIRLMNSGVERRNIKFSATAYHLYHKENDRGSLIKNDALLSKTKKQKLVRCDKGLDQYF